MTGSSMVPLLYTLLQAKGQEPKGHERQGGKADDGVEVHGDSGTPPTPLL